MYERVDYMGSPVFWRQINTRKKDGTVTKQWQATIRYDEVDGHDEKCRPVLRKRRRSKMFPAGQSLDTEAKKRNAANRWRKELEAEQDKLIAAQEQAERERAEAAEAAAEEERQRELDRLAETLPSGHSMVDFYVDSYLDDVEAAGAVEPVTMRSYRQSAKNIHRHFSGVRLEELTPMMIQKWENSLVREGRHPGTVLKYHKLLSLVCKHAVIFDHLVKNPCVGVKTPKQKTPLPNSLTVEGFAWLASTIDTMSPTPLVTAVAISLYTGMRQGEICGLRWREYDTEAQTIHVVESIGNGKGGEYSKAPKTTSSKRFVPVAPNLARILERRRKLMRAELEKVGSFPTEAEFGRLYVIGYIDGRFHSPTMICRNWKSMSESFGLVGTQGRKITFHDLRHSFATRAVAAGADVKAVSSVLGHANAAMTLNVYADADPDSKRRATNLVQQAALASPR